MLIRSLSKCYQNYRLSKLSVRSLCTTLIVQQKQKARTDSAIASSSGSDRTDVSTDVRPLGERIKENTKTASYFGVIVFGVGVTGIIAFVIFRELFSSSSPNNIYSDALKDCINVSHIYNKTKLFHRSDRWINMLFYIGYTRSRCIGQSNQRLWRRNTSQATTTCSSYNLSAKWKAIYSNAILYSRYSQQSNGARRKRTGWYFSWFQFSLFYQVKLWCALSKLSVWLKYYVYIN